jgi:hypothetical protein
MRLLLKFMPTRLGDADEAQLVREHDEDVGEGDEISMPAPLGVLRVTAVTELGADLGTVHGDQGTLQELVSQGWTTPTGDIDVGVDVHELATRWEQIERRWPVAPADALDEAAALLEELAGEQAAPQTNDAARASAQARDAADRSRRDELVDDKDLNAAFNAARIALESIAAGHRAGEEQR